MVTSNAIHTEFENNWYHVVVSNLCKTTKKVAKTYSNYWHSIWPNT